MYIPKKEDIFKTNQDDPVYFHFFPLVGYFYKKRLINTLSLLRNGYDQLLEIGYGSGILFPELSRRAKLVYGLEVHRQEELVQKFLAKEKINNVILKSGSILEIPFADNFFDCIVSVSTLEHMNQLDKAFSEIKRTLKPGGEAVLSFPVRNVITDCFFRLVGCHPRDIHPSSHLDIINNAEKYFNIKKMLKFPDFLGLNFSLYCSILCKK